MKKQIFILVMALLALSYKSLYGQKAVHDSDPDATTCVSDALHPFAGKSYNYAVTAANGGSGTYTWWVTKDKDFVTSQGTNNIATMETVGAGLNSATAGVYGVASSSNNVDISWSSTLLSNTSYQGAAAPKTPTFVVVQYDADASNCANNLKVYEIDPKNGFIVDIRNIDEADKTTKLAYNNTAANETQCLDKVSKATYVGTSMQYEYGTNYLYYEVVAANFSESYKPLLTLSGIDPVQTPTIEWTYNKDFTGLTAYTSGTTVVETDETDTSNGVSIYVRVTIVNNNYEGINDKDITLTLDGQNKDGAYDVVNSTCNDIGSADGDDKAIQTLKKRPSITEGTTSTTAPTGLIPGNESNN